MNLNVDITKRIGNFELDISLDSDVSRIGILGASGSGKSMTLRCIAGIEKPDSGRIVLNGETMYDSESGIFVRPQDREIGYMFQNYALFPAMNVKQNIACGLKCDKNEKALRTSDLMEQFDLKGLENRLPHELSGGQQQRVALARIMASRPKLVLLDEPFSALDSYLRDRIRRETMSILEDAGIKMLMVSHDRDELYSFSEELAVMRKGSILRYGSCEDVFRDPLRIETAKLTGCKNFSDCTRIDEHTVYAAEWGIKVSTLKTVPEDIRHIGYRAHSFIPIWGDSKENCLKLEAEQIEELPFSRNVIFRARSIDGKESHLTWALDANVAAMVEKKGLPDHLKIGPEEVLLLK